MIVSRCRADGCNALTIGSYCVEHDVPVTRVFIRGRPYKGTAARGVRDRLVAVSSRQSTRRASAAA